MKTHKFRQLEVWQKSVEFVTLIYKLTATLPSEEKFGLISQIRRATISICLNIAEGSGSGSDAEFVRFLKISRRSAYEVIAALEICINLELAGKSSIEEAINSADQLSAMLTGLIKYLTTDDRRLKTI
jgi:four helix bundle protein